MKKEIVQYRWEAYGDDGKVEKRGPIREDPAKVEKYKTEIEDGILNGKLAPYWNGLRLRTITRTISPWCELQPTPSEGKV